MNAISKTQMTFEEYLEFDRNSEERWEYFDGEVYSMSGVSRNHDQIQVNLIMTLGALARKKGCRVFSSDMRVRVPVSMTYRYPDLSALCGNAVFEEVGGIDILTNPSLIIEVLSDSTESFDRGAKFTHYKSIESFTEYILIAVNRPHITQFIKQNENEWIQREAIGLDSKIFSQTFQVEILLSEVYLDVEFPEPSQNLFLLDR